MRPMHLACLWKLNRGNRACALLLLCLMTAIALPAQTFTILHSFNGTDAATPTAGLVQTTNGSLYGTTEWGGASGIGIVFKISTSGTLTSLYTFGGPVDGGSPYAGLVQATNGSLYGTTNNLGPHYGTVFKITLGGKLTTLHHFDYTDGAYPTGVLVQAADGSLYGTTEDGSPYSWGTAFKITASGTLTNLYNFDAGTDGSIPIAGLVQATDWNLYGTTIAGGAFSDGTIFKINPKNGKLTYVHSFDGTDGAQPNAVLVQNTDGNLYGTTNALGVYGYGTVFKYNLTSGTVTKLYDFDNGANGGVPQGGIVVATDGNLYGTTSTGEKYGLGTIFKITPSGTLTTLYTFGSTATDGATPLAPLLQDTDGTFYGTTSAGGTSGDGTVFSLSVGLGPFVETQTISGKVGAAVKILGTNLTGATNVSFNGATAIFKVSSSSLITTTVPNGATTGSVSVTTPGGTLFNNQQFRVLPQITSFTPASGPVGTSVTITGVSLTQTLKVTFGGVAATSFTVNSDTQVTATVPAGAKKGKIVITTAGGSATSTSVFTVT